MLKIIRTGYLTSIYLLLYIPIAVLILYSFNSARFGAEWKGFSLAWYSSLLDNLTLRDAALNSVSVSLAAATLSTIVATITAVSLYRYQFRGKQALNALLFIVMMSPDIVMAISLLILFIVAGIELGFWSLLLSHITFCLPFGVITVFSRLSGFDRRIVEAAYDLGASEFVIFWKIILPMCAPAILSAWLLNFTLSLDDVTISFFMTGPSYDILPLRIYSMVRLGIKPEINALATIMFSVSLILILISQLLLKEKK